MLCSLTLALSLNLIVTVIPTLNLYLHLQVNIAVTFTSFHHCCDRRFNNPCCIHYHLLDWHQSQPLASFNLRAGTRSQSRSS